MGYIYIYIERDTDTHTHIHIHIHIHIFTYILRVNEWSTFGVFWGQEVVPTFGTISVPYLVSIKLVVSYDFCEPKFQRGYKCCCRFLVVWLINKLLSEGMVAIPFFIFFVLVIPGGC